MNKLVRIVASKYNDSRRLALENRLKQHQVTVNENAIFPNVEWLSYHIPKTAGTSLRFALEKGMGLNKVQYAYKETFASELNKGNCVWCPPSAKLLHGHFKYHPNQDVIYPNARKMIWLREPSERAWSLFNHWLNVKNSVQFEIIRDEFLCDKRFAADKHLLFNHLIQETRFEKQFGCNSFYTNGLSHDNYDFIGRTEHYAEDINKLAERLKMQLPNLTLNRAAGVSSLCNKNRELFKVLFKNEYSTYNELLKLK
ncbi:sulfotransferase family 2 domain-containing protein [Shewanella sp. TC10]|uniref:sulfotransferase family 2 domain-containing protein n=1 Tax=Shewanella sp. TC10 TaxID=1419739 RepID=UPI0018929AF0|nr:sulfotransferase family 2 domain-containing protein [Shewanella sp. TC10]